MAEQNRDDCSGRTGEKMKGILKHDFYSGIWRSLSKIIAFVLTIIIISFLTMKKAEIHSISSLSFAEICADIFCGTMPFLSTRETGAIFEMPILWLFIQLLIAYIVGTYPIQDLNRYGMNMLIRTKNRKKWWMGKVIWVVAIILLIYTLSFFCIGVLTFNTNIPMWMIRPELTIIYGADFSILTIKQVQCMVLIFPVLTSIAVSLFQLMLMFTFHEIAAYSVIGFLCVGGAFYGSPLFIANIAMALRNVTYLAEKKSYLLFLILIILIATSVLIGCKVFEKKDIFGNEI